MADLIVNLQSLETSLKEKALFMAFIAAGNGSGWFMTMTIQDRNQDNSTLSYELRATNVTEAEAEATAIRAAFDDVSQAVVTGYAVSHRYWNDSIGIPTQGELQIKARMSFQLQNSPEKETFDIPAPKETIFLALTGKQNAIVDVANPAVVAYADMFRAAGVAYISDGESLEYLLEGRKVSSKTGIRSR